MSLVPQGLLKRIARIIEQFPLDNAGDFVFAAADTEVLAFVREQDEATRAAWGQLVAWAHAKVAQTEARIFEEGRSGTGPIASPAPPSTSPAPPAADLERRLPPSKKPRHAGGDLAAADLRKRSKAAEAVLAIVRAADAQSGLSAEFTSDTAAEWTTQYLAVLTGGGTQSGFEHATMYRAVGAWRRWCSWTLRHRPTEDPLASTPVALASFLKSVAVRGPTAASGTYSALDWLRRHAKLSGLPLDAAVVQHYRHPHAGHVASQQQPLALKCFSKLLGYLENKATIWQRCAAALVLRVLLSCLRFAHVQRATKVAECCTDRTTVWLVSHGKAKGRAGFKTASPTHVAECVALDSFILPLHAPELEDVTSMLLPDICIGKQGLLGDCRFGTTPMSRQKFLDIASHLLGDTLDTNLASYAFRRWLPSIAGALNLPIERRCDLGNWADVVADESATRVKEPMAVRYSQERLETTSQVKRVCLAAAIHLVRWAAAEDVVAMFSHFAGCIKSLDTFERTVQRYTWGDIVGAAGSSPLVIPLASDLEDKDKDGNESSSTARSSTTSSSSCSASSGSELEDGQAIPKEIADKIEWVAPQRGKHIHVRRLDLPVEVAASLCIGRQYAIGFTMGVGVITAPTQAKAWCPSCIRKLASCASR